MATQTLHKPRNFTDKGVHPLVEAPMLAEAVAVETQSAPTIEKAVYAPVPTSKYGLLVTIATYIRRFNDWLAGPSMSKRERINLYLESTAVERRIGPF